VKNQLLFAHYHGHRLKKFANVCGILAWSVCYQNNAKKYAFILKKGN
jgi:hypothetical protein